MRIKNAINRYCRQIRSWLPCSGKDKNGIMKQIKLNISHYRDQNPDADFAAIAAHFGTPQSIASSYVDLMDTGELLRKLRIRRRITAIILILAAIILVTWLGTVAWAIYEEILSSNTYYVISPPNYTN